MHFSKKVSLPLLLRTEQYLYALLQYSFKLSGIQECRSDVSLRSTDNNLGTMQSIAGTIV